MEVIGFVLALEPVVTLAFSVKSQIHHLRHNNAFKESLEERANQLCDLLRSAPETSSSDEGSRTLSALIQNDLTALAQSLESVVTSQSKSGCLILVKSCISASSYYEELNDCQRRLDMVMQKVISFRNEQRRIHDTPTIGNDMAEGPASDVGLDRVLPVREFLKRSASQDLRVVCIHGLAGLGKSTLLNHVWNADSSNTPFLARAIVQIGDKVTEEKICRLQSDILRQLKWENKEFPTSDFGRAELRKCFNKLIIDSNPLFLAIDNVFSPNDLELLLPSKPAMAHDERLLPLNSCIALTSRDYGVCQSLLDICGLEEDNRLQVLCYVPQFLSNEAGVRVFAECAGMQQDALEHQDLLRELVPLCQGLPFALTILGKVFRNKNMRSSAKWQQIKKQIATLEDHEKITAPIREALQISYNMLNKPLQEAFLDMVEVFYGWPWSLVEHIVGESCMGDLKDSSFIAPVRYLSWCNQGAVREGSLSLMNYFDYNLFEGRVWMHDLVYAFGKSILDNNNIGYKRSINQVSILTKSASGLRSLILKAGAHDTEFLSHVADARNLQMLAVFPAKDSIFAVSSCVKTFSSEQGQGKLKYLMLGGLKCLESSILQATVTPGIRVIHLVACDGTYFLPDNFPLEELHILKVESCKAFQGFSNRCVQGWRNLKHLTLQDCPAIIRIPEALASLSNLQYVFICRCARLEEFPPLSSPSGPFTLVLEGVPLLARMGDLSCPLTILEIRGPNMLPELPCIRSPCLETLRDLGLLYLSQLQQLPGSICSMKALERLDLHQNNSLEELPHNIGDMASLKEVNLGSCPRLRQLPGSICSLSALERLKLGACEYLVELPHNIGDLTSLKELDLMGCKKLQKLPDSICSLSALECLDLTQCESLIELPHNIGDLSALKKLCILQCKKLQELPGSICSMKAVEDLSMSECEALMELPHNMGDLASLKALRLKKCKKLQQLPSSTCSMTSLKELELTDCESVMELPHNIGDLVSLKAMHLEKCKKLQQLPGSICSLKALKKLCLLECESLVELPHDIGDLSALKSLCIGQCKKLRELPGSICSMKALEDLSMSECEALNELPHNMGDLASLKVLRLKECKKLQQLPSSICSMKSLEQLELTDCESFMELPHNVGDLVSLKAMYLQKCKKLQQLPDSICSLKALERLSMSDCEGLVELPHNIGGLSALKHLSIGRCNKLQELPGSICSMKAVEHLYITECEALMELPHNMGDLASLIVMGLEKCKKLQQLPGSLCSMKALEYLHLPECESLVELPHNIGDLVLLKELNLMDCKKLQRLPSSICSMKALETLDLRGCESLLELPHNMEALASLKEIRR